MPSEAHSVARLKSSIDDLLHGQLIVTINQDWEPGGANMPRARGSLDLEAVRKDPLHLKPRLVFAPTAVEFFQDLATTRNHLILTTLESVQGRAYVLISPADGAWTRNR